MLFHQPRQILHAFLGRLVVVALVAAVLALYFLPLLFEQSLRDVFVESNRLLRRHIRFVADLFARLPFAVRCHKDFDFHHFLGSRAHVSKQAQYVLDSIAHDFAFLMRSLIFASSLCSFVMTTFPDLVIR